MSSDKRRFAWLREAMDPEVMWGWFLLLGLLGGAACELLS